MMMVKSWVERGGENNVYRKLMMNTFHLHGGVSSVVAEFIAGVLNILVV